MDELRLPPPGLDGSYKGSCFVCLNGTDTAIQFEGQAEWVMAAVMALFKVPAEQAEVVVLRHCSDECGCDYGQLPASDIAPAFKVCNDCAMRAGMKVANASMGLVMTYRQPNGQRLTEDDRQ